MSTSNYSWQCPTCGRQVPRKIEACRCGSARPAEAPQLSVAPAVEASPEPVRSGPNPLLVGLLLGLAVAAGMLLYLKEDAPPQQASVGASVEEAPGDPSYAAEPPVTEAELSFPADTSLATVDSSAPLAASTSSSLEDVVARTLPAVASIQAGSGRGTGFFVQRDIVITNQHVVGNEMSVQLSVNGKRYQARVTNTSPSTDLAVLQVYGPDPTQPTLHLGTAKG